MNIPKPISDVYIVQSIKLNKNEALEGTEIPAFSIKRPSISQGDPETFTVEAVGTATPQADFELYEGTTLLTFPHTVNFSANELLKTYTLKIKNDVTAESTEDFTFNIKSLGGVVQHTVSYKIMGADTFFQNIPTNLTRCTPEQVLEFEAPLADSYAWDAPAGSYTCLTPDCRKISINAQAQPLTLAAKLGFGTITAANSSIVQNITIQPNYLQVAGNTPICEGTSIRLTASGRDTYQWSPAIGLSCTNCPNPIASPTTTTTYTLLGTSTSCANSTMSVQVQVVSGVPAPTFVGLNDSYCINSTEVALATTSAGGTFTVNGQNATAFSPTALGAGTHTITYQKQEATCLRVINKSVTVIQGEATINTQPNSQFIDLNSGVTFTVAATGNTTLAYQWQEKVGTASFVNLVNTAPYSGVNTPTLSIASVNMTFNSRQYRCVLTACATAVNSNPATLDVNPLSLASATLDAQITLSPNPTKDKVWLKTKQNAVAEIEVYTSEGKFLSKITPERINAEQYELSLAKFNKGTYLLKVMVGKEFTIKRIVKE
jgi:hypothetical protein